MSSPLSVISVGEITLLPHYHSFQGQGQCKKKREGKHWIYIYQVDINKINMKIWLFQLELLSPKGPVALIKNIQRFIRPQTREMHKFCER